MEERDDDEEAVEEDEQQQRAELHKHKSRVRVAAVRLRPVERALAAQEVARLLQLRRQSTGGCRCRRGASRDRSVSSALLSCTRERVVGSIAIDRRATRAAAHRRRPAAIGRCHCGLSTCASTRRVWHEHQRRLELRGLQLRLQ